MAVSSDTLIRCVAEFTDTILEHAADRRNATPLLADALDPKTLEPAPYDAASVCLGQAPPCLSNPATQQDLLRMLVGLSTLTGDPKYRAAADGQTLYALLELHEATGRTDYKDLVLAVGANLLAREFKEGLFVNGGLVLTGTPSALALLHLAGALAGKRNELPAALAWKGKGYAAAVGRKTGPSRREMIERIIREQRAELDALA